MSKQLRVFLGLFGTGLVILASLLYWGVAPTLACSFPSSDAPRAGSKVFRFESGGHQRCYMLYLPPDFEPGRPIPLVLSLHGFSSNPHGQRTFSQWNRVATQAYIAIVYPQGTEFPQRWNADPEFGLQEVDDVRFIRELLDYLTDQLPVDRTRIFVTGFSNGAAMTLRLACELGDRIAPIGTVAAPVSRSLSTCQPKRAMPLIAFHGTQDPIVPYPGTAPGEAQDRRSGKEHIPTPSLLPANEWINLWAEQNGCNAAAHSLAPRGDVAGIVYEDCMRNASVIFYSIDGGGHTWPGGRVIPFVGKTTEDISASVAMWAFFEQHPLP